MADYVIIVAGGAGTRMGTEVPKQFLSLHGKPVLLRTIETFYKYSASVKIILGLPQQHIPLWERLCEEQGHAGAEIIVPGGKTRFQTVKSCLQQINETSGCVAIHDGVRPMVSTKTINRTFEIARLGKGAVPVVSVKESIRKKTVAEKTASVNRDDYMIVQTPQTFPISDIQKAYSLDERPDMTDDATVFERAGHEIVTVEGDINNIKITTPADLHFAEYLLGPINP